MSASPYTVDYFIAKFEAIPEELWCVGTFEAPGGGPARCAYGHCGCSFLVGPTNEAKELAALSDPAMLVSKINDGNDPRYPQPTPKQRILAALRDIKAKEGER